MYMCDSTVDGGRAYGTLFAFLGRSSAEICIQYRKCFRALSLFIHVPISVSLSARYGLVG